MQGVYIVNNFADLQVYLFTAMQVHQDATWYGCRPRPPYASDQKPNVSVSSRSRKLKSRLHPCRRVNIVSVSLSLRLGAVWAMNGTRNAVADLGMFSMFSQTGAPQKGGPHKRTGKFLQHSNMPEIIIEIMP